MAAAHASGAVALVLAAAGPTGLGVAELRSRLPLLWRTACPRCKLRNRGPGAA